MAAVLAHDEISPFEVERRDGRSPLFLICDHAGRALPRSLGHLGLSAGQLASHIAWDIGALGVARQLGAALDACLVWQRYSRLVIDCNRPLDAVDSIIRRSESTDVPGNQALGPGEADARARDIFHPYHDEIGGTLQRRAAEGRPTVLASIHSFTPVYLGVARPWHAGVLYGRDSRFARPVLRALRAEGDLVVGDNEPYAVTPVSDFSVNHHGEARVIPYVELEIRQDLVADEAGQLAWGDRLARVLAATLESTAPTAPTTQSP
jgi:predicted N-formylglutamate amidohydrolase